MGSRSRKRGRAATPPPAVPKPPAPRPPVARTPTPGPLDEFSAVAAPAPAVEAQGPAEKPKKLRGEAANEAIRAGLEPLTPGERPPALLTAIALAVALGLTNVVLLATGYEVDDQASSRSGVIIFAAIMFGAAWGMWQVRYWAILGFQTLLAITVVVASLAVTVSSNVWALLLCLAVVGLFGLQFWKLVRVMARVQMPERPGR